jgi:hypothetical protein
MEQFGCVLSILTAVAIAGASAPRICSPVAFAMFRDSTTTFLVGTAAPDTVFVGPGATKPSGDGGHWGSGRDRAVFGQVIRVDRLAGADSAALERAFTKLGAREVIVVPWDYSADCQPVIWSRTFRWVTSPAPGFYQLRPRPDSTWGNGRPILDAFRADLEPYPHGVYFERGYRGTDAIRTGPALTPVEYFTFYSALPSSLDVRERPSVARAAVDAWERAYPEIAAKYPATASLRLLRSYLDRR